MTFKVYKNWLSLVFRIKHGLTKTGSDKVSCFKFLAKFSTPETKKECLSLEFPDVVLNFFVRTPVAIPGVETPIFFGRSMHLNWDIHVWLEPPPFSPWFGTPILKVIDDWISPLLLYMYMYFDLQYLKLSRNRKCWVSKTTWFMKTNIIHTSIRINHWKSIPSVSSQQDFKNGFYSYL